MLKQSPPGSLVTEVLAMDDWKARFNACANLQGRELRVDLWFHEEPFTEAEEALLKEEDQWLQSRELSGDVAEKMLLAGVIYWEHPQWIVDVAAILHRWCQYAVDLLKCQLFAQWLSSVMPENVTPDPLAIDQIAMADSPGEAILLEWRDALDEIQLLAAGDFLTVNERRGCLWPEQPEFYLRRGDFAMAQIAQDYHGVQLTAWAMTKSHLRVQQRGSETQSHYPACQVDSQVEEAVQLCLFE